MHEITTPKIIEAKNVSFSYGRQEVLEDITFDIHKGEYVGIVGPNGSGKTTLLKIMLGLLKASHGSVRLFGKDVNNFTDWKKIGYVPQKATHFDVNFPATVEEIVLMGRYASKGLFKSVSVEDKSMVKTALTEVGMWELRGRLIGDLSGGQQQRVFIARALTSQPEVMFLDEPTTGVDTEAQNEFYGLLRKFNKELNLTLVLISHDIEMVTREVSSIVCINRTLVCHTTPLEFLKESRSANIFGQDVKIISHHHRHE